MQTLLTHIITTLELALIASTCDIWAFKHYTLYFLYIRCFLSCSCGTSLVEWYLSRQANSAAWARTQHHHHSWFGPPTRLHTRFLSLDGIECETRPNTCSTNEAKLQFIFIWRQQDNNKSNNNQL